ncbi:MAG TPA: polysaccharide biosynthesis/export family protein [Thermohalobaculum sp.]|nr:polysaccharide biosynthesis/export family protein [Thermohalobaculum sp.]
MSIRSIAFAAACLALSGCGLVYTSPEVRDGSVFGDAPDTDFEVEEILLTYETAAAANLDAHVPQRLPAEFQPDAASRLMATDQRLGMGGSNLVPLPAPTSPAARRPGFVPDRLPPRIEPQPYEIGVSDVLLLSVSTPETIESLPGLAEATAMRQGYVVQDDNMIAIPDVGRVRVGGLTVREAEDALFEAVAAAGIDPAFTLEIAEFQSKNVTVGGLVNAPAVVPITLQPLDLAEAIQLAGGIAPIDPKVAKIVIFRDGQRYQISADRFFENPNLRQILLDEGDTVFVVAEYLENQAAERFAQMLSLRQAQMLDTQFALQLEDLARGRLAEEREAFLTRLELGAVPRQYAYVAGEVGNPRRFPLPFESRANLADVLLEETRLNIEFADWEEIYVLRGAMNPDQFGTVRAYRLDGSNAVNLVTATQFLIQPNDVVFVAEQPITAWNRVLSQLVPNLFFQTARTAQRGTF